MVHLKPHGARIRAALPTRPAGQSVEEALVRFLEISQRLLQRRARQRAEPLKAWLVAKSRELLRELVVADTLAPLAPDLFAPGERPIPHVAASTKELSEQTSLRLRRIATRAVRALAYRRGLERLVLSLGH